MFSNHKAKLAGPAGWQVLADAKCAHLSAALGGAHTLADNLSNWISLIYPCAKDCKEKRDKTNRRESAIVPDPHCIVQPPPIFKSCPLPSLEEARLPTVLPLLV